EAPPVAGRVGYGIARQPTENAPDMRSSRSGLDPAARQAPARCGARKAPAAVDVYRKMLSLYLPRALDRFMTAAPAAIWPARRAARACLVPLIASLACLGLPHAAHASADGTQREFATGASPQPVAGNAEPAAKGTVARLLINPYGQVDG